MCLCSAVPKSLSLLTSLSREVFEKLITKQVVKKFSVPHRSPTYYHVQNSPPLAVPTRERGEAGTNYGSPAVRKGAVPSVKWARLCCLRFCLSRYYNYLSLVKVSTFSPSQTHSATDCQSFRFRVKVLARPPLLEGRNFLFHRGPGPLPAALPLVPILNRMNPVVTLILNISRKMYYLSAEPSVQNGTVPYTCCAC